MFKKLVLGLLVFGLLFSGISYFNYADFRDKRLAELESASQLVETSVGQIEYVVLGDSGPYMLFLHGTPGGYDQSTAVPGYRVIAPSRPGYLRTPLSVGKSPVAQAQAYAALLDALAVDRVVVMGASGGGPSALSFAAIYPDRTNALIAIEAVSQVLAGEDEAQMPPFMSSDYMIWLVLSSMSNFMGSEGLVKMLIPSPDNQQLILADPKNTAIIESLVWSLWPVSLRGAGTDNDTWQFANLSLSNETIIVPTLIIHGDEDLNVPFAQSEMLAAQIPGSVLHVIKGGDHMMPFTHEREMGEAVDQFISRLEFD